MDVLQFTLKNDTSRFSVDNNYYGNDARRSFKPIFMKFISLVRIHTSMFGGAYGDARMPN